MSLKKYEAFVKTVELGSLTGAAQALGSTQSRISHILRDLEQDYGFSLLERSRSGIRLTREGERLLPKMQAVLEKNQELEALIQELRGAQAGVLRLGTFTSVGVHWLPGMIRLFQKTHPQVELEMLTGDYHDLEQWLLNQEIDIGFVSLPAPVEVRTIPLAQDPLVAIFPRDHPLAEKERVTPAELEGQPFISLPETSAHDIHRALDRAGIRPEIRFTTKDDYALLAMVEQGLGISIVPRLLVRGREKNLAVRPLSPQVSRTIALAIRDSVPAAEAFVESAVAWLRENE